MFELDNAARCRKTKRLSLRLLVDALEERIVPTLLGQQLFPLDYPLNQNIASAPVASNSAAVIANIGASIGIHADWGEDSPANGANPLYGIPYNVVHGNTTAKINVIIDNYPGESDLVPVPIPANPVIEGDFQNGPNSGERGDSHLIVWDVDNNVAYELFGATRPTDPLLFPNTDGERLPHTDGLWHAAGQAVWDMKTNSFRTLGATSADAAGLSILAALVRPDEGLPVAQGGQGAINHALRFTLPRSKISPQYIYPGSHIVSGTIADNKLPFGARLRLTNTPAVNSIIAGLGPQAQIIATAMQQYGLILADVGSSMFVNGTSSAKSDTNAITLTWNMDDVLELSSIKASMFEVVDLTPIVTSLSTQGAAPGNSITITGQNFSGAAGRLSVFFGATPSPAVTFVDDATIMAVVPAGSGTVGITVRSGIELVDEISTPPNANSTAPIFGYGTSAAAPAAQFTFTSGQTLSTANSTVSFAAPTVAAGSTNQITIVVQDTTGAAFPGLASGAFNLSLSAGTSAGSFGAVTETATPGTYTATFTGSTAGTPSTLTVSILGSALDSRPAVSVTTGPISASVSTAAFAGPTVAPGGTLNLTLNVRDAAGNAIGGLPGTAFNLSLAGPSTGTFGAVTETATPGTYVATFTAVAAGAASQLTVTVNGVPLAGQPSVQVAAPSTGGNNDNNNPPPPPGAVSASLSTVSFSQATVVAGSPVVVTFVVRDAANNPRTGLTSADFQLAGGVLSSLTETAPGVYTALVSVSRTGGALSASVGGVALSAAPALTVVPGAVSRATSSVRLSARAVLVGRTLRVFIKVTDRFGNAVRGLSRRTFRFRLSGGTIAGVFTGLRETATKGTYRVTFTARRAGRRSRLQVIVRGVALKATPLISVRPARTLVR
jgi:hypothetical protein